MGLDFGRAVSDALKFGIQPKRWAPFFILDIAAFSIIAALFFSNVGNISKLFVTLSGSPGPAVILSMIGTVAAIFVLLIIYSLIKLWITGAVLWQSHKGNDYSKGFSISYHKYLHLLAASILVGIISMIVSLVPYIGGILSIIVGIVFFFVLPGIIVGNYGGVETLRKSCVIFTKQKLDVFLVWLVIAILGGLISLVFMLPMLAVFLGTFLPPIIQLASGGATAGALQALSLITTSLLENMVAFAVSGIIAIIGISISSTFALKAQVGFFKQLKK